MPAPTIETPRLVLRPWRDADLDPWFVMNADPVVMEYFPKTYTREESDEMAQYLGARLDRSGYGSWVLEPRDGPDFGGIITLQEVPFEAHFTPAKEVGWRLPTATWGKGLATEAAAAAIDFAFRTLGWDEIVAMTAVLNERSQRVMQRLGMQRDPSEDFDNPRIAPGNPLRRHVLYRLKKGRP